MDSAPKKGHRAPQSGPKARRKKERLSRKNDVSGAGPSPQGPNLKAFGYKSANKAHAQQQRKLDSEHRKHHVPMINRSEALGGTDPPPIMIAVAGPKGCGKTSVIKALVKHFTNHNLSADSSAAGPITVVSGKNRRLTFFECGSDLFSMMDLAKTADLILLVVDGHFGFEMETFEFLNIAQVHGFPKVMGILTHLDQFTSGKALKNVKTQLKQRFWKEIYDGAKMFYFSGMKYGKYLKNEVKNLARFISVMKFRPLVWRNSHGYVVADRVEDVTDPQLVEDNPKCDRTVSLYGYVRGTHIQSTQKLHLVGVGDYDMDQITALPDPCPLAEKNPDTGKRKTLKEKQKLIYAPMADIGDLVYDADAVYIDIKDHEVSYSKAEGEEENESDEEIVGEGEQMVKDLQKAPHNLDDVIQESAIRLFKNAAPLESIEEKDDSEGDENSGEEEDSSEQEMDMDDFDEEGLDHVEEKDGTDAENEDLVFDESDQDDDDLFADNEMHDTGKRCTAADLRRLVYENEHVNDVQEDQDDSEEFFRERSQKESVSDVPEQTRHLSGHFLDWTQPEDRESIRDRFVTGSWDEAPAEGSQPEHDETQAQDLDEADMNASDDEEEGHDQTQGRNPHLRKVRGMSKVMKKKLFDAEYDAKKSGDKDYYDLVKEQLTEQVAVNNSAFNDPSVTNREELEGFKPGLYVRIEIQGLPCEFVQNFNPKFPIVLGALLSNEHKMGFINLRFKKHRWHNKLLKNKDPLIFSIGWRRFQSIPTYSITDRNGRYRMLKYTPEHMHCNATIYGPITPTNTGVIAVQSHSSSLAAFRISATGVITELDESFRIVKKLKLTGLPEKVLKNTAFIKNMFNTSLEAAKFEGAMIRTVSGIRGQIKKALTSGGSEGLVRATFEDKIRMSDIVFCRTWATVELPQFYNPVTSTLLRDKEDWKGMRSVAELRRERNLPIPQKKDSDYLPGAILRAKPEFKPLRIPESLQRQLPYASRDKAPKARKKPTLEQRRAVPLDVEEKKSRRVLSHLALLQREREKKREATNKQRIAKFKKEQSKVDSVRAVAMKEKRKLEFLKNAGSSTAKRTKTT